MSIVVGILVAYLSNWLILRFAQNNPTAFGGRGVWHWTLVAEYWRGMFGAEMIPCVLFFVLLLLVPESPRWLIKAGHEARGLEILKKVGDILKNARDKQIRIEGHTDNVPIGAALAAKFPTNWELSTARATVVARYFQEKVGIPPQQLAPTGFAEYRPVASNDTPEGRAQNRRIEIILAPLPPASLGQ